MSDTLKQLAEARQREAEAKAEVARLAKLAEEEGKVMFGFDPGYHEQYWFAFHDGKVGQKTNRRSAYDVRVIAHGVQQTEAQAKTEALFRRLRRDGARVTGAEVRKLWCVWGGELLRLHGFADDFQVLMLLAGNAFHTKKQAERYGKDVLPKIVEELLGQ